MMSFSGKNYDERANKLVVIAVQDISRLWNTRTFVIYLHTHVL